MCLLYKICVLSLINCYLLLKIVCVSSFPVVLNDSNQRRYLLQYNNRWSQNNDYQQYDNTYDQQQGPGNTYGQPQQTQAQLWLRNVFDTITDLVLRGIYENFPKNWTKRKLIKLKNTVLRKLKPFIMKIVRRVLGKRKKTGSLFK